MKKILQQKARVLRQMALEIPVEDIKKIKIKKILKEMSAALGSQHDGVALAAPQIGYPLQIFIVSGKVFAKDFAKHRENQRSDLGNSKRSDLKTKQPAVKDLVFINPKISKLSREKEWVPEGCLSVRWLYGRTFRSKKATVMAYDEKGKRFQRGASGLLAQIFQHETDHLNGILFTDHAKEIKEELPKQHE